MTLPIIVTATYIHNKYINGILCFQLGNDIPILCTDISKH